MSQLMIWYEQLGGREKCQHVERLELFERAWCIGDKVFDLYHGWGEIKAIWRYPYSSGNKTHEWRCNAMFLSGVFEASSLFSINVWMTEDSFARDRGEKPKQKSVTRTQPAVTHRSVTRTQPPSKAAVTLRGSAKCDIIPMYDDGRTNDYEKSTGKKIIRCEMCRMWFFTNRSNAKTCGAKCRKALSRRTI